MIDEGDDRDSETNNFPDDKINNDYNGNGEEDGYFPGQQDDDDFEPVVLKYFDLALQKFITEVEGEPVSPDREPTFNNDNGIYSYIYNQLEDNSKEKNPVYVENGNVVTYTIRIYNEGSMDGYAYEISDDIP